MIIAARDKVVATVASSTSNFNTQIVQMGESHSCVPRADTSEAFLGFRGVEPCTKKCAVFEEPHNTF